MKLTGGTDKALGITWIDLHISMGDTFGVELHCSLEEAEELHDFLGGMIEYAKNKEAKSNEEAL